jgi:hypothetical protein
MAKLSTANPGYLFVLGDGSGSMGGSFAGSTTISKAAALADASNNLVLEMIDRNNVGGVIKPRLDASVFIYEDSVHNLTPNGKEIASISELADHPVDYISGRDVEGQPITTPIWLRPVVAGSTSMTLGFSRVRDTLRNWTRRPKGKHLVMGVHVTDGASTDGYPHKELAEIAADVTSNGGDLLMTNIHLSSNKNQAAVIFPDAEDARNLLDNYGRILWELSSEVPEQLAAQLGTKPGARMMAYNASIEQFAYVFEAGSSVAAQ